MSKVLLASLVVHFVALLQFDSTVAKVIGWGIWIATLFIFVLNVIAEKKLNQSNGN